MSKKLETTNNPIEQIYSPEEYAKWKEGALKYKDFMAHAGAESLLTKTNKSNLQAMFLKEKPAVFPVTCVEKIKDALATYGYSVVGLYVYDASEVRSVMDMHPDIFLPYGFTDPDMLIIKLSTEKNDKASVVRGLVLGFPLSSAQSYERIAQYPVHKVIWKLFHILEDDSSQKKFIEQNIYTTKNDQDGETSRLIAELFEKYKQELDVTSEDIPELVAQLEDDLKLQQIQVYGNNWVGYVNDEDNVRRVNRLKEAFESSGIITKEERWQAEKEAVDTITDRLGMKIDEGIKDTVIGLRLLGINTTASHEGKLDRYPIPYIDIKSPKAIAIGKERDQKIESLKGDRGKELDKQIRALWNRIQMAEEDEMKQDLHAEVDVLEKELEKYKMPKSPEIVELGEKMRLQNAIEQKKIEDLLGLFYKNRSVSEDVRLMLEVGGFGRIRLQSAGAETQEEETDAAKMQEKLAQFQVEMDAFTYFLKEKFFA